MMRSLFSGVSGLKTHQTRMDVIGNNIANVNTTAFKSSSMTFSALMSQTTQKASGANATTGVGGTNARQIGLGVKAGAINVNITSQGASQSTGNPFDIMITGENFFVVSDGRSNYFTRDGAFYVDGAGNLAMTSLGYNVMGWQPETDPATGEVTGIKKDTVSALRIMSVANMTYPPESTTEAYMDGILDKNDTEVHSTGGKVVNLNFFDELGYSYTAKFSFRYDSLDETNHLYKYTMRLDEIQDSEGNVVAGTEYTNTGGATPPQLFGTVTDATATAERGEPTASTATEMTVLYDSITGKFVGISDTAGATTGNQNFALMLAAPRDANGNVTGAGLNGGSYSNIVVDMSNTTVFDNKGTSTIGATSGMADGSGLGMGRRVGAMSGVSIQTNGEIYATYDNGMTKLLGQIATARFANASGLQKEADNLYSSTLNSGEFDGIGVDISEDGSYMSTGQLEMSNVDLSSEFTEMITTQRGFQANSRIITVSDTLLEELTNLKR